MGPIWRPADTKRGCAVVICTRNRPEELECCLKAVFAQSHPPSEILIVDNTPSDSRAEQVAMRWGVSYAVEPVPGLSRARNLGARSCRSEFVAFLDDDCLPEPGWLAALAAEFEDPNTSIVTGRVVPVSSTGNSGRDAAILGGQGPTFRDRRVLNCRSPRWFELANFGGAGDGNNMAFRRRVFGAWGGFDERLGRGAPINGNEEHYAFFQLIERGNTLVYTPEAVVRHPYPSDLSMIRQRLLSQFRASAAFMMLLFVEHPRYRLRVLRYVVEGLIGRRRDWRELGVERQRIFSAWRSVAPAMSGIALYRRVRKQRVIGQAQSSAVSTHAQPILSQEREAAAYSLFEPPDGTSSQQRVTTLGRSSSNY